MQYRSFGGGVRVSVLGIGCGRVGSINNMVPMREMEATLEAAVEAGVTLFDTADIYGQGDSERTLRTLIARHPGRLFVVTKVGHPGSSCRRTPICQAVAPRGAATATRDARRGLAGASANDESEFLSALSPQCRRPVASSARGRPPRCIDVAQSAARGLDVPESPQTVERPRTTAKGVACRCLGNFIRSGQSGSFNSGGHDASGFGGRRKGALWN